MVGQKTSADKLNKTLLFLITLFNNNNVKGWFVCYGTLLGLVRENSCIDKDDDIDIIIDKGKYEVIKKILTENNIMNFKLILNKKTIIKTKATADYASIDIYMGDFKNEKVYDIWNKLTINNCYLDAQTKTFVEKSWNGQKLYYPNNYEKILFNRYGKTWRIKQDRKVRVTTSEL